MMSEPLSPVTWLDAAKIEGDDAPQVTIYLNVDPPVYKASSGHEGKPTLSVTIISHHHEPITIFTFASVLDPIYAWRGMSNRQRFSAVDIDTGIPVWFQGNNICRTAFRRRLGTSDERHFMTLIPEIPVTVSYRLACAGWHDRDPRFPLRRERPEPEFKGEIWSRYFESGHRYSLNLAYPRRRMLTSEFRPGLGPIPPEKDQMVLWWRTGTKEEVLEPEDSPNAASLGKSQMPQIRVRGVAAVDFRVEE